MSKRLCEYRRVYLTPKEIEVLQAALRRAHGLSQRRCRQQLQEILTLLDNAEPVDLDMFGREEVVRCEK